jgi:hypothetical protein
MTRIPPLRSSSRINAQSPPNGAVVESKTVATPQRSIPATAIAMLFPHGWVLRSRAAPGLAAVVADRARNLSFGMPSSAAAVDRIQLSAKANRLHQDGLSEVYPQRINVLRDGVQSALQGDTQGNTS